jgi:hypothetical protein
MDYKKKLNQVKVLLGLSVRMAQDTLQDGTAVEAEDFTEGNVVYSVEEDGTKAPLEAGDYELSDGTQISVDADGEITEVKGEDSEEGDEEQDEEDEKMDDEEAPAAAPAAMSKKFNKSKSASKKKVAKKARKFEEEETMDDAPMEPTAMDEEAVDRKMEDALKKVAMAIEPIIKSHEEVKARLEEMEKKMDKIMKSPAAPKLSKMNNVDANGNQFSTENALGEAEARIAKFNSLKSSMGIK